MKGRAVAEQLKQANMLNMLDVGARGLLLFSWQKAENELQRFMSAGAETAPFRLLLPPAYG